MNFLVWNVRGIGGLSKSTAIHKLVCKKKPALCGLVETKHSNLDSRRVRKWWFNDGFDWVDVPANEGSGGLVLVWDPEFFRKEDCVRGGRWIWLQGRLTGKNVSVAFALVYGPNNVGDRRVVWRQLIDLKHRSSTPLMVFGDFNEVMKPEERKGGNRLYAGMEDFQAWQQEMGLVELPLLGRKYTWYRNSSASRIDRVFIDVEWLEIVSDLKLWGLERSLSDHCPLLVGSEYVDWGPKPFRVLDVWFSNPTFKKLVENEWKVLGNIPVYEKLKKLKAPIKKWNNEKFGYIDGKISEIEAEVKKLDLVCDVRNLNEVELARKQALVAQLWIWLKKKESYWYQLSRVKAVTLKDKNTKYFHLTASFRKSRKYIKEITCDGKTFVNPRAIKKEIVRYYKNLYSNTNEACFRFADGDFPKLSNSDVLSLEKLPSADEIKNAVWACESNKAPGYDGFNFGFIKSMWETIGEDFKQVVMDFFVSGVMPRSINTTWITLIPKHEGASDVKDYRPISLVGCVYKVISKNLALRMRHIMPDLIGESQSAFVMGRQILDGALIANEVVHWAKKSKEKIAILKLDFHKAYDTISWRFIDHMLENMGFGKKWRGWINACLSSASFSILVNGSPTAPVKMERGLRQGDPLSPFLFVLAVEALNILVRRAVEIDIFKGIEVGNQKVMVSHLQFADDTLVFCPAKKKWLLSLRRILDCFYLLSGLEINFSKSALIVLGKEEEWCKNLASSLGCRLVTLPITYLGIPLGANPNKASTWQPILVKLKNKLSS